SWKKIQWRRFLQNLDGPKKTMILSLLLLLVIKQPIFLFPPTINHMPHLAPIHYREFEKFLLYVGCIYKRQSGDHRVYWRSGLNRPIIVPTYKALPIFVIRNNLRLLSISVEEYLTILEKL